MKKTTTKSKSINKKSTTKKTTKKVAPKKTIKKVDTNSTVKKIEPVKEITKKEIQLIPKKISICLLVVGILFALSIILGYTYSIYQIDKIQPVANEITVGCFTINFEDSGTSNSYTNFSLTNSYPIDDEEAMSLTPYKFKITNVCNYTAKTDIAINVLKTSSISQLATNQGKVIGDMVNVAIQEGSKGVSVPIKLSSFNEGVIRSNDTVTDKRYIIRTDYLQGQESRTYNIWMWVPESINNVEVENEAQGLTLYAKVDINSTAVDQVIPGPELYEGLIPVEYNENGNTIVADTNSDWYDYEEHKWANAVLGTPIARSKSAGQTLSEEEILQYYVWIPRYRYKLFNAVAGESADEQMIEVVFEDKETPKSNGDSNGEWLTHPAFTFGSTELNGIWVGKFEPSHSDSQYVNSTTADKLGCKSETCTSASGLIIKPNKISIIYNNVSNYFYASRSIENSSTFGLNPSQVDTHMMKNMEWGAVAYLSSSKYGLYKDKNTCYNPDNNKSVTIDGETVNRCEMLINNVYTGTGCGANEVLNVTTCGATVSGCSAQSSIIQEGMVSATSCESIEGVDYSWNSQTNNGRSSTTGNIYGIYDMAGGNWEYVMGNEKNSSGDFYSSQSGFSINPEIKYYDSYEYADDGGNYYRGLLGDATREIIKQNASGMSTGGTFSWNGDYSYFPHSTPSWFIRGGYYRNGNRAGVFAFHNDNGISYFYNSFRIILTAEDK